MLQCGRLVLRGLVPRGHHRSAHRNYQMTNTNFLEYSNDVIQSLRLGKPVVGLETSIITHGLPYPENLQVALSVEDEIRKQGVTPATIYLRNGRIVIGADAKQLKYIAENRRDFTKASRRDLSFLLSQRLNGSTTVSATVLCAHMAGIPVVVTGGLGGVHIDGENSLDVSADLSELGRTPVAVICSGVKAILDIGKTLEVLETNGVGVFAYGCTNDFPNFYSRLSGYSAPYKVSTPGEAASVIHSHFELGLNSGLLFGVPVPVGFEELGQTTCLAIDEALEMAKSNNIRGRDVTPFVLEKLNKLTGGDSVALNIELIMNNAYIGAKISSELSRLNEMQVASYYKPISERLVNKGRDRSMSVGQLEMLESDFTFKSSSPIVLIGGSNVDLSIRTEHVPRYGGPTNPGNISLTCGGVARNIADCLGRIGSNAYLVSAVGDDDFGKLIRRSTPCNVSHVRTAPGCRTAVYSLIHNTSKVGSLLGIGDLEIHEDVTSELIDGSIDVLKMAKMVVIDGNYSIDSILTTINLASVFGKPCWYETTDVYQATKPFCNKRCPEGLVYVSPNQVELQVILKFFGADMPQEVASILDFVKELAVVVERSLLNEIPCLVITLGRKGILVVRRRNHGKFSEMWNESSYTNDGVRPTSNGFPDHYNLNTFASDVYSTYYPAHHSKQAHSVSGAGDCAAAGIVYGILQGWTEASCVRFGQELAVLSLASEAAVPDSISDRTLKEFIRRNLK